MFLRKVYKCYCEPPRRGGSFANDFASTSLSGIQQYLDSIFREEKVDRRRTVIIFIAGEKCCFLLSLLSTVLLLQLPRRGSLRRVRVGLVAFVAGGSGQRDGESSPFARG